MQRKRMFLPKKDHIDFAENASALSVSVTCSPARFAPTSNSLSQPLPTHVTGHFAPGPQVAYRRHHFPSHHRCLQKPTAISSLCHHPHPSQVRTLLIISVGQGSRLSEISSPLTCSRIQLGFRNISIFLLLYINKIIYIDLIYICNYTYCCLQIRSPDFQIQNSDVKCSCYDGGVD
jgi:hypothetical protein